MNTEIIRWVPSPRIGVELVRQEADRPHALRGKRDQDDAAERPGPIGAEGAGDLPRAVVDGPDDGDAGDELLPDPQDAPPEHVVGEHAEGEHEENREQCAGAGDREPDQLLADRVRPPVEQAEQEAAEEDRHRQGKGDERSGDETGAQV